MTKLICNYYDLIVLMRNGTHTQIMDKIIEYKHTLDVCIGHIREDRAFPFYNLSHLCDMYMNKCPQFHSILKEIQPCNEVMRATVWHLRLTSLFRQHPDIDLLSENCTKIGSDAIIDRIMCTEFPDLKLSQYTGVDPCDFVLDN
jgi:hypothetical protein